jgi:hypothetical protein
MKLIDKIIKLLVNYKYKKVPFMAWCWGIDDTHEINILSAEYYSDHYRYGTKEYYKAESEVSE